MITRKPGIIFRLGNLIIVQVLFVFAALALILFVPEQDHELDQRLAGLERDLLEAGRDIVSSIRTDMAGLSEPGTEPDWHRLVAVPLDGHQNVGHVAVIRIGDSARLEIRYAYTGKEAGGEASSGEQDVSSYISYPMLHLMASMAAEIAPQTILDTDDLVYYHRLAVDEAGHPTMLVIAIEHGLTVSSQSYLEYAVLVLFLFSALVSLLTVNLLLRKFKRPLDHIIAGFEETADGKLHNLGELESDPHLGKLTCAYNAMTRKLWDNRKELDDYFSRLGRANAELRESQSFLMTLFDATPLSVIVTDPDGTIIMFNRTASEVFGYEIEEAVGRPLSDLLNEETQTESEDAPPDPSCFEVIGRRHDGGVFPGYVISSQVSTECDRPRARLYVCRDITDSKNFQEMMIRLDRYYTRGEMAGDIAHEINNYLAVLLGNVELIPLMLKKGRVDKVEAKLDVMKSALEKIARFSDGLLDGAPDTVRLEPASINQIVENVIAFLKPQNKFDTVQVIKELSTDIPVLHVDPAQIQQLLVNLIYNAAEAMAESEGDRIIHVATEPVETDGGAGVQITVRDSGPGVARDKEGLLFRTRFTTKPRGHGIGLITCRKIVDNHEGDITYRASDGAVFTVGLPVLGEAAESAETATVDTAQPA